MKTLDEVIKGMEHCHEDNCMECPYQFEPKDFDCITQCQYTDALHYLKEYQKIEDEYHELKDWWAEEYVTNDPLTWDELKQMEGKPVWVEHHLFKGWRLVGWQANEHMMNLVGSYSERLPLFADGCGTDWQAYRKERS